MSFQFIKTAESSNSLRHYVNNQTSCTHDLIDRKMLKKIVHNERIKNDFIVTQEIA